MKRRPFLATLAGSVFAEPAFSTEPAKYRAAVIGDSARGGFGHAIDRVFDQLAGVEVVAVADPEEKGRKQVLDRHPDAMGYDNYREMLAVEKPSLVAVCPRWTDQHHAMTLAALQAGAHVFLEKPITGTLAEADELLAEADRRGLKIAVAHQMVFDPNVQRLAEVLKDESLVGPLEELRLYGKMDHRVGGEDLIVLGTHLFDMTLWLAETRAVSCVATVLEKGRPFEQEDVRRSFKEDIGPIVGTHIEARFELASGVPLVYKSAAAFRDQSEGWGIEWIGARGKVRIYLNHPTLIVVDGKPWPPEPGAYPKYAKGEALTLFNRLEAEDWLRAIEEDRQPLCSGRRAMQSLEMIHAVFASGRTRGKVALPLKNRNHPLG